MSLFSYLIVPIDPSSESVDPHTMAGGEKPLLDWGKATPSGGKFKNI